MVLPKIVGAVLFLPWFATVIINNLPTEQRLKIQKSALLQSGATMRVVNKNEKPKVRGARLPPDAVAITEKFKKVYPRKDLELLWGAMLKCYGSQANAILAARSNPQILNPSYSFCNTMLESKRVLLGVLTEEEVRRRDSNERGGSSAPEGFAAHTTRLANGRMTSAPAAAGAGGDAAKPIGAAVWPVARGARRIRDQILRRPARRRQQVSGT